MAKKKKAQTNKQNVTYTGVNGIILIKNTLGGVDEMGKYFEQKLPGKQPEFKM